MVEHFESYAEVNKWEGDADKSNDCAYSWYRKGADSILAGVNIKHFGLLALVWGQWLMKQNVVVGSFPQNGTYRIHDKNAQ